MLFSSFAFLIGFLPVALGLYALAARFAPSLRLAALLVLSLVFYGWWDWRFLPFLIVSVLVNWGAAQAFLATGRRGFVIAAILVDLAALGLFKYALFFADAMGDLFGLAVPRLTLALPLGISFFTFHHVMYLVDLSRGQAPRIDVLRYGLYIAFFPQVLSGPLVRWREILAQFDVDPFRPGWRRAMAAGLALLILGLAKKVFLADPLAADVAPVYAEAAKGGAIALESAWQALIGFTFQIYFDFSGYTDMALGLALMFGITLPQNFRAPYRAASLRDFWRDWHMTLSRFLRDYLYVALGGNRHGLARQLMALFLTMLLGGLWHGAGYNFLIWGAAHGAALGAGVLWRRAGLAMPAILGWALTFAFVAATWVFFHAATFDQAIAIFKGLAAAPSPEVAFRWRTLALAAALALIGPTSWDLVTNMQPRRSYALLFALLGVAALLKLGDEASYEFIYFRF
ncbi:MAG: MBOAT family protein [Methylobacteriaceae bacterium]|nr:MBOAT family protein [Methylobacteriaceae bacterium]